MRLVGNALKFTQRGGHVRLSVEVDHASDDGPGIPAEELPHLFDRYWKGRATGKRGTGLGLFIAKGIVAAHGGELLVARSDAGARSFW